jgi:hypothetical protein
MNPALTREGECMELRTVRRGLAALAIAAVLGIAGAYPAGAAELGWLERGLSWLSGLWIAEGAAAEPRPGNLLSIWAVEDVEKGYGADPNGTGTQGVTPPPGENR